MHYDPSGRWPKNSITAKRWSFVLLFSSVSRFAIARPIGGKVRRNDILSSLNANGPSLWQAVTPPPLSASWADDFVGVDPKGNFYDKAKMVADTRAAPKYFVSNHLNQVRVRFYGNTAVAQGDESWERRTGEDRSGRFVWTDTWIRRNGQWQIVAAEDLIAPEKAR